MAAIFNEEESLDKCSNRDNDVRDSMSIDQDETTMDCNATTIDCNPFRIVWKDKDAAGLGPGSTSDLDLEDQRLAAEELSKIISRTGMLGDVQSRRTVEFSLNLSTYIMFNPRDFVDEINKKLDKTDFEMDMHQGIHQEQNGDEDIFSRMYSFELRMKTSGVNVDKINIIGIPFDTTALSDF